MEVGSLIRAQLQGSHQILEGTMQDVTAEQAHWAPPGKAIPLGATYAHILVAEDGLVNGMAKGAAPLLATSWAGKTGMSEPPPGPGAGWDEWARTVKVDLGQMNEYAKAVFANTDEYVAALSAQDLERSLDLSGFGLGQQTLAFFLGGLVRQHVDHHCGEASCLKGLQGAKGYPF